MKCKKPVRFSKISGLQRCGQCRFCRIKSKQERTGRILLELRAHNYVGSFLTLTYSNDYIPEKEKYPNGNLVKKEVQDFIMRLRHHNGIKNKLSYFAVGEYGDINQRAHFHLIIYGIPAKRLRRLVNLAWTRNGEKIGRTEVACLNIKAIDDLDKYEDVVNIKNKIKKTINRAFYAAKYTLKKMTNEKDFIDGRNPEFILMSKKPALGVKALELFKPVLRRKNAIPIYGLSAYERWYIEKNHSHLMPWNNQYNMFGKSFIMDKFMQQKLFDITYPEIRQEINQHLEQNEGKQEHRFKAEQNCKSDDKTMLTLKFTLTEEYENLQNKLAKLERREHNTVKKGNL